MPQTTTSIEIQTQPPLFVQLPHEEAMVSPLCQQSSSVSLHSISSCSSSASLVTASSKLTINDHHQHYHHPPTAIDQKHSHLSESMNDAALHDLTSRSSCSSASSLASCFMRSGNSTPSTAQQQSQEEEEEDDDDDDEEEEEEEEENEESSSDFGDQVNSQSENIRVAPKKNVLTTLKRYLSVQRQNNNSNNGNSNNKNNNNCNSNSNNTSTNTNMMNNHYGEQRRIMEKSPNDQSIKQLLSVNRRQIQITTCAQIYNQWRRTKRLYYKTPENGIQLEVDYIDTGLTLMQHIRDKAPIVLALHGAPGSYNDFSLLIQHLARQTVRVIAPNFPEYAATVKTKTLFRHSADEKASYLRDFLRAINVNKIDLLVSHSSAVFPSLLILLNDNHNYEYKYLENTECSTITTITNSNSKKRLKSRLIKRPESQAHKPTYHVTSDYHIQIRALALFNPAGHRLPQSMKPLWFKCGSVRVYQNKIGRALFQKFGSGFLTIVGVPVRVDNMDHVMLSATVMRNSQCQRMVQQLNYLNQLKLPTLLVFSENDKLIEKDIFYEMTQFMGLDRHQFDIYNNQGEIERAQSSSDHWIRVMVFKAGGHYAYSNYANTVNKAVTELLCKVCSGSDKTTTTTTTASHANNKFITSGQREIDDELNLKLMLPDTQQQQQHQRQNNIQKVTLITNRSMDAHIKRHFKW